MNIYISQSVFSLNTLPIKYQIYKPLIRHRRLLCTTALISVLVSLSFGKTSRAQSLETGEGVYTGPRAQTLVTPGTHISPWNVGTALIVGKDVLPVGTMAINQGGSVTNTIGYIGYFAGSSGTVIVKDTNSKWTNSKNLSVGFSGKGELNLTGGGEVSNTFGYIGSEARSSGTVTVFGDGSKWINKASLIVGNRGGGALNITAGGSVTNTIGYIGYFAGSSGTAAVKDTNSKWTNSKNLSVGFSGKGELNLTGGGEVSNTFGYIGSEARSSGTVTVFGDGSKWINKASLIVGNRGGGALNITAGGSVTNTIGYIGYFAGSSGTAAVKDTNSKWTNSNDLSVGFSGTGALNITGGGEVTNSIGYIGEEANSSGTVTVFGGGSKWINKDSLIVGNHGGGALNITAGGSVTNTIGYIGYFAGSSGTAAVKDTNSKWTNSNDLSVGFSGTGALNITGGGEVTNSIGYIGDDAGSSGTVTVFGAGSKWINKDTLIVGNHGGGALNINAGGSVTNTIGYIGYFAGSSGTAAVKDTNSKWTNSNDLSVGFSGTGALNITGGGEVTNSIGYIGEEANSSGTVTVDGDSAKWINSNILFVGRGGTGVLNVTGGGLATNTVGYIGYGPESEGSVTVKEPDSKWINSGSLYVGKEGKGELTIQNNGIVTVGPNGEGNFFIGDAPAAGTVNFGGTVGNVATGAGSLNAGDIIFGSGTANLNFNHTDTDYQLSANLESLPSGTHTINHVAGTTTLKGNTGKYKGAINVSGGTLIVKNDIGGSAAVTGGTLQFGAIDVGGTSNLSGDLNIKNAGSTLAVAGTAVISQSGNVLLGDNTNLSISSGTTTASIQAAGMDIRNDVTFNLSGISTDADLDRVLIQTRNGITGDFAKVTVGGFSGPVDYMTLHTAKTADNLQYKASYGLSWTSDNNLAHGTFTLVDDANKFTVDTSLGDQKANLDLNWDGKSLTKTGAGTLILATDNTFTGGTTIADGTLQIGNGGNKGSIIGNIVNDGALVFKRSDEFASANSISGSGTLVQAGTGTLKLTGNNSYNGGTELRSGIVEVASDNALGSSSGHITFNGGALSTTESFDTARDTTFAQTGKIDVASGTEIGLIGSVSGSGDLVKRGEGTLRLDNASNAYANTHVEAGSLVGNAASIKGDVFNAGTVVFDQFNVGSFAGNIAGYDGINGLTVKEGVGDLSLTGLSALDWDIAEGTLKTAAERFTGNATIANSAALTFNQDNDATYQGKMSGDGLFTKSGTGKLVMDTDNSAFIGTTHISRGSLIIGSDKSHSDAALGGSFKVEAGSILGGHGTIGSGSGSIVSLGAGGILSPGNSIGTLTINGDIIGNGGRVNIETVLAGDNSQTDKLLITGNTSGSAVVRLTNKDGTGDQTVEGIEIISVGGSSDGVFTLQGDYVVAGAYTYRLYKNNGSGTDPNDWYLRSALTDQPNPTLEYHVGAPVYETYPQVLLGLNGLSTLQQRVGNRFWAGSGNRVIAEGADAIVPYAAPEEAGVPVDGNGVWGRIEGAHNSIDPRFSTTGTEYKQNTFKLQAGVDGLLTENVNGTLIGGIFVQYVHGKTKTSSADYADGEISTDGYGFGGTLTWYGNEGFYIDGQAQATWYNSDLTSSAFDPATLVDGNDGIGYALSIETGKRIAIDPQWSVTPQAQLVYSSFDFDSFTDSNGSHISLDRGDSLQGRLGITLDYENSWQNAKGLINHSHVYGIANLYYEFLEGTKVNIEDVSFASRKERLWGGIGVGGSYNWDNDKYSIYGEGNVNTSLNNFGDSYSLKGNVGFRVKW